MTAKEIFLKRIKDKLEASKQEVTTYTELYTQNEKLPDSFFEGLIDFADTMAEVPPPPPTKAPSYVINVIPAKIKEDAVNDYGRNKKLVVQILSEENKALLKNTIIKRFEGMTGETNATAMITNAISALANVDKVLVGYKPNGARFRGNYWALSTWMDGDNIKPEHAPLPLTPLERLMLSA